MTSKEELLGKILSRIADELNITDTMYKKAVSSYEAVGEWLGEGLDYSVRIMPQGSMNLGTVVRPLNDKDDYDIDLVCLLEDGKGLSARKVKTLVGDRLKEHEIYKDKLDEEGKRCWTMQYDEFHMDILPCIPRKDEFVQPGQTSIDLTDKNKKLDSYSYRPSDPAAFHDWFVDKARPLIDLANSRFAARATEIKPVPSNASEMKTPLQKAIQLLKRHRDVLFINDQKNAPISVIITTLAAQACPHETNVYVALKTILERMEDFVEFRDGKYWVSNPVMPEENFAEKWNEDASKRLAFVNWCRRAYSDFVEATASFEGLDEYSTHFREKLKPEPVDRAFKYFGESAREAREKGALRLVGLTAGLSTASASAGKAVAAHTFFGR